MSEYRRHKVHGAKNVYKANKYKNFSWEEAVDWVGGEDVGITLQENVINFLIDSGLKTQHVFLDIGAGCFRCSIPIMEYLDADRYFAIDGDESLLRAGWDNVSESIKTTKRPKYATSWNWEFELLGNDKYDFMLCQGVICHTPEEEVRSLMTAIDNHLEGVAYVSFVEGKRNDRNPYRWEMSDLEAFSKDTDLKIDYIGKWGHPRDVRMCAFTK